MAVEFEELGAVKGYSFNPVDLGEGTDEEAINQKLIPQLESTVERLQDMSGKIIAKIYIGKTYILIKKERRGKYWVEMPFRNDEPKTWKKNGISGRWLKHKGKGRDGLVVLCAVTEETVPEAERPTTSHEQFALAIEENLIKHYQRKKDKRIVNDDKYHAGKSYEQDMIASCVYMAFTYATEQEETLPAAADTEQGCPVSDQSSPCSTSKALPTCPHCQKLEARVEELFSIVARMQDEMSLLKKRLPIDIKVERPAAPPASRTSSRRPNQKSQPAVTVKQKESAKCRGRKY